MRSVKGKRVLVTGGAMGMGRLFAERAIAEQAAAVVLWDVNEAALNDTLNELADSATEISGYIVDVADAEEVAGTAAAVLDDLNGIDVLINNAGVVRGNKYFWETDLEHDTKATIDINTLGPMYVAHEFLPAMIAESGECRMLNLASAAGFTPNPRMAVYAAAKWAVIGFTKSLAIELGPYNVRCNAICPGNVKGERINTVIQGEADLRGVPFDVVARESVGGQSIARFVEPEEVADLCVFLGSDKARMINGEAIAVDGHAETFHIK